MSAEYYGPTVAAVERLNRLLDLPATGHEQDWEIEFADPAKLGDMLRVLRTENLDEEEQCALSALALHSLEEAAGAGIKVNLAAAELRGTLAQTPALQDKMRFYWSRLSPEGAVAFVLG
ncbi:hypothetical protein [Sphingomonas sp. OTU376]|uniref:hypothetical protein n=1 Tax=Sphingomonas sp. OTU376 TaxID=3043863 RepID=UPI00313CCF66